MRIHHGEVYLETGRAGLDRVKALLSEPHSLKRGRTGWLVYAVSTGATVGVFKTRLRAYYVASVLSGRECRNFFFFGGV